MSDHTTHVSVVLSAFSLILWSGPSRFLPGYTDTLPHAATRQGTVRGERWLSRDGRYFSVFRSEEISASKSSIRRFVITEKAPTTAFTFKTQLRHYAKRALTPWSLNVKLGLRCNYHKGRAAIRHYANQTAHPF